MSAISLESRIQARIRSVRSTPTCSIARPSRSSSATRSSSPTSGHRSAALAAFARSVWLRPARLSAWKGLAMAIAPPPSSSGRARRQTESSPRSAVSAGAHQRSRTPVRACRRPRLLPPRLHPRRLAAQGEPGLTSLAVHPRPGRGGHHRPHRGDRPPPTGGGRAPPRRDPGRRRPLDGRHRRRRPPTPAPGWCTAPTCSPTPGRGRGRATPSGSRCTPSRGDLVAWVDGDITDFGPRFVTRAPGPAADLAAGPVRQGLLPPPRRGTAPAADGSPSSSPGPSSPASSPPWPASSSRWPGSTPGAGRCWRPCRSSGAGGSTSPSWSTWPPPPACPALAQVDLGTRRHRHRPLDQLSPQAMAILTTALRRAGVPEREAARLVLFDGTTVA